MRPAGRGNRLRTIARPSRLKDQMINSGREPGNVEVTLVVNLASNRRRIQLFRTVIPCKNKSRHRLTIGANNGSVDASVIKHFEIHGARIARLGGCLNTELVPPRRHA